MKPKPIILAADDQASILNTIASILRPLYNVRPLPNGQCVLNYMTEQTADLILLDYEMPGLSGLDVLERLRDKPLAHGVPIVFLTGSEGGGVEVEVLEKGAADYIHKPVQAQVLLTRIRLQLELSRYKSHMETLVDEKTRKLRMREDIALNLLAEATDMRDHDTGDHIKRTTELVRVLVDDLLVNPKDGYSLTPQEAEDIIKSAKLHDLGKIAVADRILLKPTSLDEDEFCVIKEHPLYGARLLDKYNTQMGEDSFLNTARDIALHHHEKWDGTGYPYGLSGERIPLSARITALADVYDALISPRPYKERFSHEKSMEIVRKDSGTHFDPYLADVFIRNAGRVRTVYESQDGIR